MKPKLTCDIGRKEKDPTTITHHEKVNEMVCDFFDNKVPVPEIARKYGYDTPDLVYEHLESLASDGTISKDQLKEVKKLRKA
jgi:hypothetical protein